MPIVPSAVYNNPDIGGITKNLGIALFGADALDPEARAKGRYYDANSAKAAAESAKLAAETQRISGANRYFFDQAKTIHDLRPPDPGEDLGAAQLRRDTALANFNMGYAGNDPNQAASALSTNTATALAQNPDDASKMTSLVVQGKPLPYRASVSPGQQSTIAQQVFGEEKMKADTSAAASMYGADRSAGAAIYGHNKTYQAAEDRIKAEHPFPGMDLAPDHTFIPVPGGPALDTSRAYTAPGSSKSGGQPLTVNAADAGMLDLAIARGYDGAVTEAHGKSPAIINPQFWASVGPQARQAAELAAQDEFQRSHSPARAAVAGQAALAHAAGTPWSAPGWFAKGGFGPEAGGAAQPQQGATAQPRQGAAPVADPVAIAAKLHPEIPANELYADEHGNVFRRRGGAGAAPQTAAAAPQTAALPPTAQVFAPPAPNIAAPAIPDSGIPQFDVQSPELAAGGFNTPSDVVAARQSRDPATMARVKAYDAAQQGGSMGPQREPVQIPDFTKLDPVGIRFIANDKGQPDEVRAAATNYLLHMPAQRTRH